MITPLSPLVTIPPSPLVIIPLSPLVIIPLSPLVITALTPLTALQAEETSATPRLPVATEAPACPSQQQERGAPSSATVPPQAFMGHAATEVSLTTRSPCYE